MPNEEAARPTYVVEEFTEAERAILSRYFTNLDRPVFCLINLPELVKGALYARYSRTAKSTRRLFLDEFVNREEIAVPAILSDLRSSERSIMDGEPDEEEARRKWSADPSIAFRAIARQLERGSVDPIFSMQHAEGLYRRVFDEYGDDSVSQLGGVHIVFEQASNIVINLIEWGRLAAYLEQSTRYIDFSSPLPDGRFRYYLDPEIMAGPHAEDYAVGMDELFGLYQQMLVYATDYFARLNPREDFDGDDRAYRTTIRAKAFDTIRPMLPAGIVSNVGFFGSAQAAANMLRRLLSSELSEARVLGQMALEELRHPDAAPAFFNQIDDPEKGLKWLGYFEDTRHAVTEWMKANEPEPHTVMGVKVPAQNIVELGWSDPDNELKVCAAIIYEYSEQNRMMADCMYMARQLEPEERAELIRTYCGDRGKLGSEHGNRRWKPGRAFEQATYNFDFLIDFGIMRDWKRHRMLSIDWGRVEPGLGWTVSPFIEDMEQMELYEQAMRLSSQLYGRLLPDHPQAAQYATCLGYRMRVAMTINARALLFMLELRTSQQGHPSYRKVGQEMHRLVCEVDPLIGEAMSYVDYNEYNLERAGAEKRLSEKRAKRK